MEEPSSPLGRLLRQWRGTRRMSQLDLALEAGISSRHLSFIETGRSQPSREVVMRLASAMDVPLRDCNSLLGAAGFARVYRETGLDEPDMAQARKALDHILRQQEPFPAFVLNRGWDINIRESTVLGLVGAGGIGLQLQASMNILAWPQVTVILIAILFAVLVSEWVLARVRHAII